MLFPSPLRSGVRAVSGTRRSRRDVFFCKGLRRSFLVTSLTAASSWEVGGDFCKVLVSLEGFLLKMAGASSESLLESLCSDSSLAAARRLGEREMVSVSSASSERAERRLPFDRIIVSSSSSSDASSSCSWSRSSSSSSSDAISLVTRSEAPVAVLKEPADDRLE